MSFRYVFLNRVRAGLSNPNEVLDSDIDSAITSAKELSNNKKITDTTLCDVAMYRLKVRLNATPSEDDVLLYEKAIKTIEKAPSIDVDDFTFNAGVKVRQRSNQWA